MAKNRNNKTKKDNDSKIKAENKNKMNMEIAEDIKTAKDTKDCK